MTRARNSANLASDGNLFVDISNDRTGIGSVAPAQNLHVAGTAGFHADTTFVGDLYSTTWDRSENTLRFNDSALLKFGTGNDANIRHDGNNTWIQNNTGYLYVDGNGSGIRLISHAHWQAGAMAAFYKDGGVVLYHDANQKFTTTAYGTNITGTTDTDGLIVSGVATVTTMNVTGVLTYDDVTSVDSIGIVTARSGLNVSGGNVTIANDIDVDGHTELDNVRITGIVTASSATVSGNQVLGHGNSTGNQIKFTRSGLGDELIIGTDGYGNSTQYEATIQSSIVTARPLVFATNNTERLRIAGGGTVTISSDLNVAENIIHTGDTDTKIRFTSDVIQLQGGGTTRIQTNNIGARIDTTLLLYGDAGNPGRLRLQEGGALSEIMVGRNSDSSSFLYFKTEISGTTATRALIDESGHFRPNVDGTYDLGINGTRWRRVYADNFYGDGSNLTGITQTTINTNADNRVITGSGTANTLNGEANLTYDGTNLQLITDANNEGIKLNSTASGGSSYPVFEMDANRSAGNTLGKIISKWNGTEVASIQITSGSDSTNKDDAHMYFNTASAGTATERLRITSGGQVNIGGDFSQTSVTAQITGDLLVQKTASAYLNPNIDIYNYVNGGYAGSITFSGKIGGSKYSQARIRAYGGSNTSDGALAIETGNMNEKLRITSDGKFGFGTNSPDQMVHIHKGSAGSVSSQTNTVLTLENSTTNILQFLNPNNTAAQVRFGDPQDDGIGFIEYSHNSNTMSFGVYGPTRMQLDSNGHLGIAVASAAQLANSKQLTLRPTDNDGIRLIRPGDANNSPNIHLDLTTTTSGSAFPSGEAYTTKYKTMNCDQIFETYEGGGTGGNISFRTRSSSTESLRITPNGDVKLNATIGSTGLTSGAVKRFDAGLDYWNSTAGSANAIKYAVHGQADDNMYGIGISASLLELQSQVDIAFFAGGAGSGTGRRVERMRITSGGLVNITNGNLHVGQDGATADFTDSSGGYTKHIEIGATGGGDALLTTHASGYGIGYFGYHTGMDRLVVACDQGGGSNSIDFVTTAGTSTGGNTDNLHNKNPRFRIRGNGGFRAEFTDSDEVHAISNYDHGNNNYTNRNGRTLHSNGTGWDGNESTDGSDPILVLSVANRAGNSDIGDAYGLQLHSESQDDNDYAPMIGWTCRSNSGNYNTTIAAIVAQKKGQAADHNWSSGALHFFTNKPNSINGGYMNDQADMSINEKGYISTPRQPSFLAEHGHNSGNHKQKSEIYMSFIRNFQHVRHNIGSCFNNSTGKFTAPVAGIYLFHIDFTMDGGAGSDDSAGCYFRVENNSTYYNRTHSSVRDFHSVDPNLHSTSTGYEVNASFHTIEQLAAGATCGFYFTDWDATNTRITTCFFSGYKVG